jgi:hypothetical protein
MDPSRRQVLSLMLLGAGRVGLRALATGLPISFLLRPAHAARGDLAAPVAGQHLILSTSSDGDPLNVNVPGTYDFADIVHPADPAMAKTPLSLAGTRTAAAAPWASLPQAVLDRTLFFHHATLTNKHPGLPTVMRLVEGTAEMLPSIIARHLAERLGTLQREPLAIGTGQVLSFAGRPLPDLSPTVLRDALTAGRTPLAALHTLRDQTLDAVRAALKQHGGRELRRHLDQLARSRAEARSIGDRLLDDLHAIRSDAADGQIAAAAALIKLNVAPVIAISIPFGGDNHFDNDLAREARETVAGVSHVRELMARLKGYGLEDRVSLAMMNVFGRTLKRLGRNGRDHWDSHHATVLIGRPFRGGIVGGLAPAAGDYRALGIDSRSGAGTDAGDVPFAETLAALGKTLGRGLGLPEELLDESVPQGRIVRAALV